MNIIILAAGKGERLRPLTDERPKCLVPLLGMSLLERQATIINELGLPEPVVVTGYRGEMIQELGFEVRRNERFATTNMVESLFAAEDVMKRGGDTVVIYGDIVYQKEVLQKLLASEGQVSLAIDREWERYWRVRMEDPLDDAETLKLDDQARILELGKKPQSIDEIQGQYIGMIKFSAHCINDIVDFYHGLDRSALFDGKDFDNMYMTSFLQALINNGFTAQGVEIENGWLEIDSTEDLAAYESLAATGDLAKFYNV
ncbi:MAG: phosphocholine cytidylyltransferase family protein [Verrucomicrobiales bacterium]|nr:phosphocholine cytidylyltransferase family protein [Verrucomicrobiales bacterium]